MELFVINQYMYQDIRIYHEVEFISGIYTDLETAKTALNIYNNTTDYEYYGYKIIVYRLEGNKFTKTNKKIYKKMI